MARLVALVFHLLLLEEICSSTKVKKKLKSTLTKKRAELGKGDADSDTSLDRIDKLIGELHKIKEKGVEELPTTNDEKDFKLDNENEKNWNKEGNKEKDKDKENDTKGGRLSRLMSEINKLKVNVAAQDEYLYGRKYAIIGFGFGRTQDGKPAGSFNGVMALPECLNSCYMRRLNEDHMINGVVFYPNNQQCHCEKNTRIHQNHPASLHYTLHDNPDESSSDISYNNKCNTSANANTDTRTTSDTNSNANSNINSNINTNVNNDNDIDAVNPSNGITDDDYRGQGMDGINKVSVDSIGTVDNNCCGMNTNFNYNDNKGSVNAPSIESTIQLMPVK